MRRFFQTTILLLALMLPAIALAHDFEVDGIYYNINGDEATVTYQGSTYYEFNEYTGNVVIPETVTYGGVTYRVTSIGQVAFAYCSGLITVKIGNAIKNIGQSAFIQCNQLYQVDIPNSVTTIDDKAFAYCSFLSSVNIPNSVTTIGQSAFYGCNYLSSVEISDLTSWLNISFENYTSNPLTFAHRLFLNGNEVTDLTVPETVSSIGQYAFYGCSSLSSLTIGNSVTSIGQFAFYGCGSLSSLSIGNSVTSIGECAFEGCHGLKSLKIGNSVSVIGSTAFRSCSGLTSIVVENSNRFYDSRDNCNAIIESANNTLIFGCQNTVIPNTVTTIYNDAFYQCSGLRSITIPRSVTTINGNPFAGCTSLSSIVVESGNLVYDSRDNCNAVVETASNTLIVGCRYTIIPNTVTTIGTTAFNECRELAEIKIPNSVVTIGDWAFCDCSRLYDIKIPNSVTSIGELAFWGCTSLMSVTIGNSVASIGEYAFNGCTSIYNITCHAQNPPRVEDNTFENENFNTAKLWVPGSYVDTYRNTEIWCNFNEVYALNYDLVVNGIYFKIEDDHAVVLSSPYDNRYSGDIEIPSTIVSKGVTYPVTVIGNEAFAGCEGVTSIYIPNSVTTIGREAFGSTGLTSIVIPSSVTFIDEYAFSECKAMQSMVVESDNSVYDSRDNCNAIIKTASNTLLFGCQETVIPNTVTAIGNHAFNYSTRLKAIVIPNSVITIGEGAFYGCSGMTSLTIGNSVTKISDEAFEYCTKLKRIVIPNSVNYIGFEAFAYCYGLNEVTIGKSVTTMENGVFYCCEALTDVYCNIADPTNVINLYDDDECEVFYSDYGNYAKRTLHVPTGSMSLYQSSELWYPFFGQIVEMTDEGTASDVNGDGSVNIGDMNQVINTILSGNQGAVGDVNKDGAVNISDVNLIINYILTH